MAKSKLKVLDLFSGIGGFSLGLERAGFKTIAFCEIDKPCHKVLKKHWPKVPIVDDVSRLDGYTLQQMIGKIDVLCGGFPCTDISIGGKQKGITKETRSGLWFQYKRIIDEIRPKYVIIENVERIRKNGLGIVLRDLAEIGYDAEWSCITAHSVGLPHQRDRLFIISYPSGKRFNEYIRKGRSLFINEQWPDSQTYSEGKKCLTESIEICPILSKRSFDDLRHYPAYSSTIVSSLRRVTNGVPYGMDEYKRKQRIKQLGNSIIPGIAEIIGRAILEVENGEE